MAVSECTQPRGRWRTKGEDCAPRCCFYRTRRVSNGVVCARFLGFSFFVCLPLPVRGGPQPRVGFRLGQKRGHKYLFVAPSVSSHKQNSFAPRKRERERARPRRNLRPPFTSYYLTRRRRSRDFDLDLFSVFRSVDEIRKKGFFFFFKGRKITLIFIAPVRFSVGGDVGLCVCLL